jgi:hypothetical protein
MNLSNDLVEDFLKENPDDWYSARTIYEIISKKNTGITNILQVHASIRRLLKNNKLLVRHTINADNGMKERLIKWRTKQKNG